MSRKLHQTAKATTLCLALPFVHFPATGDVWPLTVVYVSASRRKHGQYFSPRICLSIFFSMNSSIARFNASQRKTLGISFHVTLHPKQQKQLEAVAMEEAMLDLIRKSG
ncbi:hypothetical protein F2Q69_00021020 [Brassica cretica]|uniref:Uncharacterized protein n=1 Tax=Brassica cretica TaxID=69181 RepID=A0A8S9QI37_BRACR|nr:hypothetical protein F2Q69_00021020 [Brassica cretica]